MQMRKFCERLFTSKANIRQCRVSGGNDSTQVRLGPLSVPEAASRDLEQGCAFDGTDDTDSGEAIHHHPARS